MSTYTKHLLSGSTNGRPIKVAASSTPGTLIHTAISGTTFLDEIYIYAINTSGGVIKVTLEWGGTTSPDDLIEIEVAGESGLYVLAPGLLLNNGLVVRAFAGSPNLVNIVGFVNRIT